MTFTNVIGSATLVFGVSYGTAKGYGIGFTTSDMLWVTLVANIVAVMTIPLFGALSDRIGRRLVDDRRRHSAAACCPASTCGRSSRRTCSW